MNMKIIGAAVVIAILFGGAYWFMNMQPATPDKNQVAAGGFGTYAYECDEHVTFTMSPTSDMSSITITPSNGAAYPPASTLAHKGAGPHGGQMYEGNGVTFTGKGESVTITSARSAPLNCSPVADPNNAPFNFGD
jgi:hypothetical protein